MAKNDIVETQGIDPSMLTGNAYRTKVDKERDVIPPPTTKKIADGKIKVKTARERSFFASAIGDVSSYVFNEVIIPAIKVAIFDTLTAGANMLLFNGERVLGSNRPQKSRINYAGVANTGYRNTTHVSATPPYRTTRRSDEVLGIEFDTREDAENVLDHLYNVLEKYESVSVSVLYQAVGLDTTHTDNKYGWKDLRNAKIVSPARDVWSLVMPAPEPLT